MVSVVLSRSGNLVPRVFPPLAHCKGQEEGGPWIRDCCSSARMVGVRQHLQAQFRRVRETQRPSPPPPFRTREVLLCAGGFIAFIECCTKISCHKQSPNTRQKVAKRLNFASSTEQGRGQGEALCTSPNLVPMVTMLSLIFCSGNSTTGFGDS